jgi:hypothetical protein
MGRVDQHFQRFLREHIYLHNVAPKKSQWYRDVWQVFQRWWTTLPSDHRSRTVISRSDLQEFVVHLRERGVDWRSAEHLSDARHHSMFESPQVCPSTIEVES